MNAIQMTKPAGTPESACQLFCAATSGDSSAVQQLIAADPELMHHQIWYEFPIHYAVRAGHADCVQVLLNAGINPARSNYTYSSWQKLLPLALEREREDIHQMLVVEMHKRFNYSADYRSIWNAIEENDLETLKRALANDPGCVHIGDEHGNRALHWAVLCRRLPIAQRLLDAGADIDALRADLQTPLHVSLIGDYWYRKRAKCDPNTTADDVTNFLIDHGATYEFSAATARGDIDEVKKQLHQRPELAQRLNDSQRSPLGHAARNGQVDVVRLLLDHGADPNLPESCAERGLALFEASSRNDIAMMQLLLDHGADANAGVDSCGNCLSIADQGGEHANQAIALLRKQGAQDGQWSLDTPEKVAARLRDRSPLDPDGDLWSGVINGVLKFDQLELLELFVERFGTEPICRMNATNGWRIPQSEAILNALLKHGMDINARDWFGRTFLHYVAYEGSVPQASWLIDHGIDINAIDHQANTTAIGLAAESGELPMVNLLLERGADASIPHNATWATPLRKAQRQGHDHICERLRTIQP